jgi:ATP-dependent exoDNAse (exonuclease V) alpha subunit
VIRLDLLPGRQGDAGCQQLRRDVFNGDLGVITSLDMGEGEFVVSSDGRPAAYGFG